MSLPGRLFRLALHLYPPRFRGEFAAEMSDVFEDEARSAGRSGWRPWLLLARSLPGLARGVVEEWAQVVSGTVNGRLGMSGWGLLGAEVGHIVRDMRRRPGFTTLVLVTLGAGFGANLGMVELVDRLFLRPPALLIDADEVRSVYYARTREGGRFETPSLSTRAFTTLTTTATYPIAGQSHRVEAIVSWGGTPRSARVTGVSAGYWSFFDAVPVVGRFFDARDDVMPAGSAVTVLSHRLWRSAFGGDPEVVGAEIAIGEGRYTVVGVAPPDLTGLELRSTDLWIPLNRAGFAFVSEDHDHRTGTTWISAVARVPATAIPRVEEAVAARLAGHYAEVVGEQRASELDLSVRLYPLNGARGPNATTSDRVSLWLMAMSVVVLLVSVANVAILLLGRALDRGRETAIRAALGVSSGRMLLRNVIEGTTLALLAGGIAAPLGQLIVARAGALLLPEFGLEGAGLHPRGIAYAVVVSIGIGVLLGLGTSRSVRTIDLATTLRGSDPRAGRRLPRLQAWLPGFQAALSALLLVGAGLFLRSVDQLDSLDLGFDAEGTVVVEAQTSGTFDAFAPTDEPFGFTMTGLADVASRVPGVQRTALASATPFGSNSFTSVYVEGSSLSVGSVWRAQVDPDYFATVSTPIIAGRGFTEADADSPEPVLVVGETLAARAWPGESAVGRCLHVRSDTLPCYPVVGVVRDIVRGEMDAGEPLQFYYPRGPQPRELREALVVRMSSDDPSAIRELGNTLQATVPSTVLIEVESLQARVEHESRNWTAGARIFTAFGALALLMACVGLFSSVAYDVARRMAEFGIRRVLGAQSSDLAGLVLRKGLAVSMLGTSAGLLLAFILVVRLEPLLFRVSPRDPITFLGVAAVLLGSATAASFVPLVRASRSDPLRVIQSD